MDHFSLNGTAEKAATSTNEGEGHYETDSRVGSDKKRNRRPSVTDDGSLDSILNQSTVVIIRIIIYIQS